MTSSFSSNEATTLEREVEFLNEINSIDNIWNENDLKKCIDWIHEQKFTKVIYTIRSSIYNVCTN